MSYKWNYTGMCFLAPGITWCFWISSVVACLSVICSFSLLNGYIFKMQDTCFFQVYSSFYLLIILWDKYYPHFTNKETQAQRGSVTLLWHRLVNRIIKQKHFDFKSRVFTTIPWKSLARYRRFRIKLWSKTAFLK